MPEVNINFEGKLGIFDCKDEFWIQASLASRAVGTT